MRIGTYSTDSAENYSFIRRSDAVPSRLNFTIRDAYNLYGALSSVGDAGRFLSSYTIENNGGQLNTRLIITPKGTSGQKGRQGKKDQPNFPIPTASALVRQESGICGLLFVSSQMKMAVLRVQGYGVTHGTIPIPYGNAAGPVQMPLDGVGAVIYTQGRTFKENAEAASGIFDEYFLPRRAKEKQRPKEKGKFDAKEFFKTAREIYDGMTEAQAFREGLKMGRDGVEKHWARFWDHFYNFGFDF